jgi:hypothetical protein
VGLLTVFANFRIDSEERLLRMQDSFYSFCEANIEMWVINIRGPLKNEAAEFLKIKLGGRLKLFKLESKKGWFHDSRLMLHEINSAYVFFWIEDHLCLSGINYFNRVVAEMKMLEAEYLPYSAFHEGETLLSYSFLPMVEDETIVSVNYDGKEHKQRMEFVKNNKLICVTFVISCCAIFNIKLFKKIVLTNDPFLNRWSKYTPFDFEKNERDTHWLPIRVAQTKREFFACIDDDFGRVGHSLIARGLYPDRVSPESRLKVRRSYLTIKLPLFFGLFYSILKEKINLLYVKLSK